ncbi:MAG: potassium-transporting ATPase subunit KdpA [Faecalibacterium sp.]|jgi:K+-transporting ATPase ATPase A chain|nr:potassium-transporting ATPase subunit KdpA [Faecalibacterium sp.]
MASILQYVFYLAILVVLAIPLGAYIKKVMYGEKTFLSKILTPCENLVYKVMRVKKDEDMSWKKYLASVLIFSGIGFVFLFLLQLLQGFLPGNPQNIPGTSWHLAFNTASSFVTNTNWQAYSGESALSYLTQALGLTVQNFVSAATGIAVLFALIRGFTKVKEQGLGSFWVDMTRAVIHILLPLNLVIALCLVGGGVVQSLRGAETVQLLEPVAVSTEGEILQDAVIDTKAGTVTVDGELVPNAQIVTREIVPLGPAASQVAIKQTGTNGGGFYGVNSAHPLENPNAFTNLLEMISLLLIPAALCFTFGKAVKNKKQGIAIFMAMFLMLVVALGCIAASEQNATTVLNENPAVNTSVIEQSGGNMEGKETRFGIATSSTWAAFTTAASNGSVNSMHDSYTPLGGMVQMLQMQLGEVIFGGVGCGLYGMLAFAILTVFIAGLMVGRTPEFLGKKIEPYEMKWSVLVCLATPIGILVGSGIAAMVPEVMDSLNNGGAHGFSEMLYAYTSGGGNNGSAFAGFNANTPFLNVSIGLVMLFVRFLPIIGTLAIAGSLAPKKKIAVTAGTLSTTNAMFVFLLIFVVLLIGALSFFPALALGPLAEFFGGIA